MKRLFWVAVGAAVGVVAMRRLSARAAKLTPQGLAEQARERANGLGAAVRTFAEEVRDGIEQRENELAEAMMGSEDGRRGRDGFTGIDPEAAARFAQNPDRSRLN